MLGQPLFSANVQALRRRLEAELLAFRLPPPHSLEAAQALLAREPLRGLAAAEEALVALPRAQGAELRLALDRARRLWCVPAFEAAEAQAPAARACLAALRARAAGRLHVRAPAGVGKTWCIQSLLTAARAEGIPCRYITFNRAVADALRLRLGARHQDAVLTASAWRLRAHSPAYCAYFVDEAQVGGGALPGVSAPPPLTPAPFDPRPLRSPGEVL
jgi:hypothetical protein